MGGSSGLTDPGRPSLDLEEEILHVLDDADVPLTATMITEELDGPARKTVYNYIQDMDLQKIEYGRTTAYTLDEPSGLSAAQSVNIIVSFIAASIVALFAVPIVTPGPITAGTELTALNVVGIWLLMGLVVALIAPFLGSG